MTRIALLPEPLPVLRRLVFATGCAGMLPRTSRRAWLRADRNGSADATYRALCRVEDRLAKALERDCGSVWRQTFERCWRHQLGELGRAALAVDIRGLSPGGAGRAAKAVAAFEGDLALHWLREARGEFDGPALNRWFEAPLGAWLEHATAVHGLRSTHTRSFLAALFDVPERTLARRLDGGPLRNVPMPSLQEVRGFLEASAAGRSVDTGVVQKTFGWLVLAFGFGSMPESARRVLRRRYREHDESVDIVVSLRLAVAGSRSDASWPASGTFRPGEPTTPHSTPPPRASSGNNGDDATASGRAAAVRRAWWRAGAAHEPLLEETLVFASGTGDRVLARECWARLQLLGLVRRDALLDEREHRRLAIAFNARFAPTKAKGYAARRPGVEADSAPVVLHDHDRRKPLRPKGHPRRLTRRSVFMETVAGGDLMLIRASLDVGGADPDQHVDTGETALSIALERAWAHLDVAPLHLLLDLPLSSDTVTRPFGPFLDTPIGIAIEIGDLHAIGRLAGLGASVNGPASCAPTALAHALSVFFLSTTKGWSEMGVRYAGAEGGADVYDAALGAITDTAAARRRTEAREMIDSSPELQRLDERLRKARILPPSVYRRVVRLLLALGACPNQRYEIMPGRPEQWTATLVAAEIGDLELMQELVRCGGRPDLLPYTAGRGPRIDALELARRHGHGKLVRWLERRS